MNKELLAIACSDLHLNDWAQFNENNRRLDISRDFLNHIFTQASSRHVPILFSGDLYHTPKGLSTQSYEYFNPFFKEWDNSELQIIYGISGNHDMPEKNFTNKLSPSLYKGVCHAFPYLFRSIEYVSHEISAGVYVHGIPYLTHNIGFIDTLNTFKDNIIPGTKNILIIHTDIWGARDPSGREVGSVSYIPRNLGKFFKEFDLVLAGHIHQYAELWPNKVYMVGAPYQQRKSDMGCKMGFLYIYNDMSIQFVRYGAPEFKVYNKDNEKPDDYNFCIPIDIPKKRDKKNNVVFTSKMDKRDMARSYAEKIGVTNSSKISALINILNRTED